MDDSQVASVLDSADDQAGSPNVKAVCAYLGPVVGQTTGCGTCSQATATDIHECRYGEQKYAVVIGKVRRWRGIPIDLATGERVAENVSCCGGCPHNTQPQQMRRPAPTGDLTTWTEADVAEVLGSIRGPAQRRGKEWHFAPAVVEAHRRLFRERLASLEAGVPWTGEGRGIVVLGGGPKYFPAAYALCWTLRAIGCLLPVELWHLPGELDADMLGAAESLAGVRVRCVDTSGMRRVGGWEAKLYAIRDSEFREVLYLDADQIPARDPSEVFDWPEYREHGAVLWPDLRNVHGLDLTPIAWRVAGIPDPGDQYTPIEAGQVLVDKWRCWQALEVARHIVDHSDFWFPVEHRGRARWHIYGDKSAFLIGFACCQEVAYAPACGYTGDPSGAAFLQRDFSGAVLFQHNVQPVGKLSLFGRNVRPPGVVNWDHVEAAVADLRQRWRSHAEHREWHETAGLRASMPGEWLALLPGQAARQVTLAAAGTSDLSRLSWRIESGRIVLDWRGKRRPLQPDGRGNWVSDLDGGGDCWLMPAPPREFDMPRERAEIAIWSDIVVRNEYRLPERFEPQDTIIDIGAHCGIFALECLRRGAGRVICVEPDPDNFARLQKNLRDWTHRTILIRGAAWSHSCQAPFGQPEGAKHTGGGSCWDGAGEVPCFPFAGVLALAGGPVRLLKLDCEGAEWPVIWTADLGQVGAVCGEWHGAHVHTVPRHAAASGQDYGPEGLEAVLRRRFGQVEVTHKGAAIGNFYAAGPLTGWRRLLSRR